jgi:xanthine/CO dehydrogenase XdhC/CoxF family maturation factor
MDDRARAIEVLKRARDMLVDRLSQEVVASEEALLEDALGLSYGGEIAQVFEQVGNRLHQVSVMLSNLPTPEHPLAEEPDSLADGPAPVSFTAVMGPPAVAGLLTGMPLDRPTLERFTHQITAGQFDEACRCLAQLFELDDQRARRCTITFTQRYQESPEVLRKATRLRDELISGSINSSLMLLWECFGLQGLDSLAVARSLKARLVA